MNQTKTEKKIINDLLGNHKYCECLFEIVNIFQDYVDEASKEKSYSYLQPYKSMSSYSIEPGVSPIYQEIYTDDDEIEKMMDESKILLQTLEKQNIKLNTLNERINKECKNTKSY